MRLLIAAVLLLIGLLSAVPSVQGHYCSSWPFSLCGSCESSGVFHYHSHAPLGVPPYCYSVGPSVIAQLAEYEIDDLGAGTLAEIGQLQSS